MRKVFINLSSNFPRLLKRFALGRGVWLGLGAIALGGCAPGRLLQLPMDPAGLNPTALNSASAETEPRMAGPYVVFVSDRRGSQDVYLYDVRSRRMIDLPGLNALDAIAERPAVSEDGNWIVLANRRQGRTEILLYNRETRQIRPIAPNLGTDVRNPTISADGRRIAFEINRNGQWDIALFSRDGQSIALP